MGTINMPSDAFAKAKSITTSNVASEPKSNLTLISPGNEQENGKETNKQEQRSRETHRGLTVAVSGDLY